MSVTPKIFGCSFFSFPGMLLLFYGGSVWVIIAFFVFLRRTHSLLSENLQSWNTNCSGCLRVVSYWFYIPVAARFVRSSTESVFSPGQRERQTDRETDRQTDRQAEKETDRQTETETDRDRHRETQRQRNRDESNSTDEHRLRAADLKYLQSAEGKTQICISVLIHRHVRIKEQGLAC